MNKIELKQSVLQVLAGIVPGANVQALKPNVSFHDQIELDSIDFLRLMMELEKVLQVSIPDNDYPQLSTLQGCVNYLARQVVVEVAA